MCGIIGMLSRQGPALRPDLSARVAALETAVSRLESVARDAQALRDVLPEAARGAAAAQEALSGLGGLLAMLDRPDVPAPVVERLARLLPVLEGTLDEAGGVLDTGEVETLNAALILLKDVRFVLARDRLANLDRLRALAPEARTETHWRAAYDLNAALNALDRLEVRGRDSAGIHVFIRGAGEAGDDHEAQVRARSALDAFTSGAVRRLVSVGGDVLWSLVYKVAAEVGELGDNVRTLRRSIRDDLFLHALLARDGARAEVLGHTRWASVGAITESNAHPLNQEQTEGASPYVVGALNGDVDNHEALVREFGLKLRADVTTDAKVIPALVSDGLAKGDDPVEAFRRTVARLDGSVAIACAFADAPGLLALALRGSGQALYVGLAGDAFLVASEPYGVVEECDRYLRLDGETPVDPARPDSRGQIVLLDASGAGDIAGIRRLAFDGTAIPVTEADLRVLEITTRDVDRGEHSHFLRKEIDESPESFRKTLRGRLGERDGGLHVHLGEESLPESVRARLRDGRFRRILVIGQGTAAVAGKGVADLLRDALKEAVLTVQALPATEVSAFHLRDDMSDELVVAISQSGTTTDTNRTVDLLRARGAAVIGIVNRRQSDLTDRVDGVLYTSDGRDVEMSVASTKAFYSQIAAGALLADALAETLGVGGGARRARFLGALQDLPNVMRRVLLDEERVAEAARTFAPPRRHWAVVGNGRERVAAQEIRIKLSELCYKSIACDATEDKKHIDLSAEPLVFVCAAGARGAAAVDVGKEVDIFAAHKACPIVVATEGAFDWPRAAALLTVPRVEPELAFVLTTMIGHLFGYHAALAIDETARPLRSARGAIEVALDESGEGDPRPALARRLDEPYGLFQGALVEGRYDGTLDARVAARLALSFRYATGAANLAHFRRDFTRTGTPEAAVEELGFALTTAIDDLTRPVDAIKHQAKTVTVGISRGEDVLMAVPLVRAVRDAGAPAEFLLYDDLQVLKSLDPAVVAVDGATRYSIDRAGQTATTRVVQRTGVSKDLPSRTDADPALRGTKNTVAMERHVLVAVGRSDGRPIVLVPEIDGEVCVGLVLLHARFAADLDAATLRAVLGGYRNRYALIRDAVAETGALLADDDLVRVGVLDLLTRPVLEIADRLTAASA